MGRILFRMLSQYGHIHGTFSLAEELKQHGHTVIYAAPLKFKTSIEINGFEFFEIHAGEEITRFEKSILKNTAGEIRYRINRFAKVTFKSREVVKKATGKSYFKRIIRHVMPDLILLDSSLKMWGIQFYNENIPFITVQTFPYAHRHTPPRDSFIVPENTMISKLAVWWSWRKYYLRRVTYLSPKKIALALAIEAKFPMENLDFTNEIPMGFKNVPEINTIPSVFDFQCELGPHKYYFNPGKMFSRKEFFYDFAFDEEVTEIRASGKKVVFCAFGSLAWRYPKMQSLIEKLVCIFKNELKDHVLILCIDNDLQRRRLRMLHVSNMYLYKYVPQQRVLSELADVMITHGGMNSIIECIFTHTPIFIFPGSRLFDQVGNASRVKRLGIGKIGKHHFSAGKIKEMVLSLLYDEFYKVNLDRLNDAIRKQSGNKAAINLINAMSPPTR